MSILCLYCFLIYILCVFLTLPLFLILYYFFDHFSFFLTLPLSILFFFFLIYFG